MSQNHGDTSLSSERKPPEPNSEFQKAGRDKPLSLGQEFWIFIKEEKKWWMVPILLVLGMLGLVAAFSSTGAAPFIYTLF
jgi:hypothetical protein